MWPMGIFLCVLIWLVVSIVWIIHCFDSTDGTYYGIASLPSAGLKGRIVCSRKIQFGTYDKHDARKMSVVLPGRSKVKDVLSQCR